MHVVAPGVGVVGVMGVDALHAEHSALAPTPVHPCHLVPRATCTMASSSVPAGTALPPKAEETKVSPMEGVELQQRTASLPAEVDIEEELGNPPSLYFRASHHRRTPGSVPEGWECPTCGSVGPLCRKPDPVKDKTEGKVKTDWKPLTVWCAEVTDLKRLEGCRHNILDFPAGTSGKIDQNNLRLAWTRQGAKRGHDPLARGRLGTAKSKKSKKSKGQGKGKGGKAGALGLRKKWVVRAHGKAKALASKKEPAAASSEWRPSLYGGKKRKDAPAHSAEGEEPLAFNEVALYSAMGSTKGTALLSGMGVKKEHILQCTALRGEAPDALQGGCNGQCGSVQLTVAEHPELPDILHTLAEMLHQCKAKKFVAGLQCTHGKHSSVALADLVGWSLWVLGIDQVTSRHTGDAFDRSLTTSRCECWDWGRKGWCPEVGRRAWLQHPGHWREVALSIAEVQSDDLIRARTIFLPKLQRALEAAGYTVTVHRDRMRKRL